MFKKFLYLPIMWFGNGNLNSTLNRTDFDQQAQNELIRINSNKKNAPSIAAIYRVKNGSASLELSIKSIAAVCNEIIIVNNCSTDQTLEITMRLKDELKDVCTIKIFNYNHKVSIAGKDYMINSSEKTLADFYNYSFSLAESEYLWKVDAHYIFTSAGLCKIQNKLKKRPRFIILRGCEIFGKKLSYEMFIFKNNKDYQFVNGSRYEELKLSYIPSRFEMIANRIFSPSYIHVKRLSFISMLKSNNIIQSLYK